jgi:glycosyltransferase involved in cell wall biosynthesis
VVVYIDVMRIEPNVTTRPPITLITVVYNGKEHLLEAMRGVWAQTYPHVEYIVVDGGSTDGTVELIRGHEARIHQWVSEPDGGLYDAMNKGVAMATGQVVAFTNADDALLPTTCETIARIFEAHPEVGFVCGAIDVVDTAGNLVGRTTPLRGERLTARMYHETPFPHPGVFARRQLFQDLGGFDTRYRLCADWELMLRWLEGGVRNIQTDEVLARFRSGGRSASYAAHLETRTLLRNRGLGRLHIERVFWANVAKAWLVNHLPLTAIRGLQRLRPHSRHTVG